MPEEGIIPGINILNSPTRVSDSKICGTVIVLLSSSGSFTRPKPKFHSLAEDSYVVFTGRQK